jgi:hypothetical protein
MKTDPEIVKKVCCDVFEQLAFMFSEDPEEDEGVPTPAGGCVLTAMGFSGPAKGRIALAVPEDMCPEIAANVLGVDPDDELVSENAHDALKEMLNVMCGRLLTELAGEEPVFELTVPEVRAIPDETWQKLQATPGTLALLVDDSPVLLRFEQTG